MGGRIIKDERDRLILIYFVVAAVCSFLGTFFAFVMLEPNSIFWQALLVVVIPAGITASVITHLSVSIDRNIEM